MALEVSLELGCWNLEFSLFQRRQHFGIAHVHPAALDFQAGDFVVRREQGVDGVGQLIFAARGFLEFGGELEQRCFEDINARVVPDRLARLEQTIAAQLLQLSGVIPLGFDADGNRMAVWKQSEGLSFYRVRTPIVSRLLVTAPGAARAQGAEPWHLKQTPSLPSRHNLQ